MGEKTNIAWVGKRGSTFNPWWGCTPVGPECENCYAAVLDASTGGHHFEIGSKPRTTSTSNWRNPRRWNKAEAAAGTRRKVFSGSMCDVFDINAPECQRERLWKLIKETPNLDWLILTKRPSNIAKMLPEDWGDGYPNVGLGVSVGDKKHGLPRIDVLRTVPSILKFLSIEPLIEDLGDLSLAGIDWVIVGGESGESPRVMKPEWVMNIFLISRKFNVPFFFKQWGGSDDEAGGCIFNGDEIKEWPKGFEEYEIHFELGIEK
jgi:protein gp37